MVLSGQEIFCFGERSPNHKKERNDHTTHYQGNAPSPVRHLLSVPEGGEPNAEQRRKYDSQLLAGGLPTDIEALVTRRGDFRQIDGTAPAFHSVREALQQPPHTNHHS